MFAGGGDDYLAALRRFGADVAGGVKIILAAVRPSLLAYFGSVR